MEVSRTYQLPVSKTMRFAFEITDGKTLSQKVGRRITSCNISDIKSIVLKDSKAFGTQVLKIRYYDPIKGKERKFMRLEGAPEDVDLNRFIADLKELIPSVDVWDQTKAKSFKKGDKNVYDMQVTMWGYTGVGLPRKVQIWVIFGTFSLLLIPIPLLIYVLINKCFQVETDDKSIILRKYKSRFFYWSDLQKVDLTRANVRIRNEGVGVDEHLILRFKVHTNAGKRVKFKMRMLEGKPFLKELVQHQLIELSNDERMRWGIDEA